MSKEAYNPIEAQKIVATHAYWLDELISKPTVGLNAETVKTNNGDVIVLRELSNKGRIIGCVTVEDLFRMTVYARALDKKVEI